MTCPICGSEIKTIPAGISKTSGKPYGAFQACSNRNCTWKPMKPQKPVEMPSTPVSGQSTSPMPSLSFKPSFSQMNTEIFKCACDLVIQKMKTSEIVKDPIQEIIATYTVFMHELK